MNIYLDTNILYSDPLFKSSFSDLLLKSVKSKSVNLCIPDICLDELFVKLLNKAKQLDNEAKTKFRDLSKWTNTSKKFPTIDLINFETEIREFYDNNFREGHILKIFHEQQYFSECLEKAIKGTAPFFSNKKEEFRDSLIWTTVREHSKSYNSVKDYFVTTNYADFWNHEKLDFHPNLKEECGNLLIIESIKKLFDKETQLIDFRKRQEFIDWLEKQNLNQDRIELEIKEKLWDQFSDTIKNSIGNYPVSKFKPDIEMGYISPIIIKENFHVVKILNNETVEDFATLELETKLRFEGRLHYPNHKKGDFSNFESYLFRAQINFYLTVDRKLEFQLLNLKLITLEYD